MAIQTISAAIVLTAVLSRAAIVMHMGRVIAHHGRRHCDRHHCHPDRSEPGQENAQQEDDRPKAPDDHLALGRIRDLADSFRRDDPSRYLKYTRGLSPREATDAQI